MLDRIQRFIHQALAEAETEGQSPPTLELATAALLCEVMRADYRVERAELDALEAMLKRHFQLDDATVRELMAMAREEAETSVDHYRFVSLIKQHYSYERRCELVRMMWGLALADGDHHPLEEHRIRRLAELLHVGHSDFIRAKLDAQGE